MKLYIAHVGFYDDQIGMYELHSNFFVVAEDIQSAKKKIREKEIFITKKMLIDGLEIQVTKQENPCANLVFDYDAVKNLV